jgi:putative endonuclease
MSQRTYYVYIMANIARTLYTGVTNSLYRRVWEHKTRRNPGFTTRYGLTQLVYFESYEYVNDAIAREKQIKGWLRVKKIALIETTNPQWIDLSAGWYEENS